jgi:hypothetical protein
MKAIYDAECWAIGKTKREIKQEIAQLDERYYKPYPWNGTENANQTIERINALTKIYES